MTLMCSRAACRSQGRCRPSQHPDPPQRDSLGGRLVPAGVLDDEQRAVRCQRRGGIERAFERSTAVRWIEKNDVERRRHGAAECLRKPCADNSIAVFHAGSRQVPFEQPDRPRVVLHEGDVRCSPAQRFNADSARARETIEEARAVDVRGEDVEQRLPKPIRRRTQPLPIGRRDPAAFEGACDDAHGVTFVGIRDQRIRDPRELGSRRSALGVRASTGLNRKRLPTATADSRPPTADCVIPLRPNRIAAPNSIARAPSTSPIP